MNILMMVTWYTPKGADGLEAGVFHYEQSMDLKKHCNVALYFPFDQQITETETKEVEWGLETYRSRFLPGRLVHNKRQMAKTMERIVREFHPDIIHAHCGCAAGHYAIGLGKRFHLPVVVTEHSPTELTGVDHFGTNYLFAKRAYRFSSANICVSVDSQQKLSACFPDCTFDVIYNGIILPDYDEGTRQYYKEGYLNIVIVAILYDLEIKGMKYLLKAMQILKKQGRKIILHHVGGGEYLQHFQDMARRLEIDDVCVFHGKCDRKKLYEIVNEMDFFVSASLMECSGVSVQEAMLLGKPVLGTNSGGVDSLVPSQAGYIVKKADAGALADGITYMEENLEAYDRKWIRSYARKNFEISNISQRYMELYQKILDSWR